MNEHRERRPATCAAEPSFHRPAPLVGKVVMGLVVLGLVALVAFGHETIAAVVGVVLVVVVVVVLVVAEIIEAVRRD